MRVVLRMLAGVFAGALLAGAPANAKVINKFAAEWDFGTEAVLIDVRTPAEWATGTIAGAHKISVVHADGRLNSRFAEEVAAVLESAGAAGAVGTDGAAGTADGAAGTADGAAGTDGAAGVAGATRASKPVVLICRSGARSARAAALLEKSGFEGDIINLQGGMLGIPASIKLVK